MKQFLQSNKLSVVLMFFLLTQKIYSQTGNTSWSANFEKQKVFIENKGQFQIKNSTEPILFAYDNGSTMVYFTAKGVTYSFLKTWKKEGKENEKEAIQKGQTNAEIEAEERKLEFKTDVVSFVWKDASETSQLVGEEASKDYHSYSFKDSKGNPKNENFIKGYKKIIYKNIYPNIDIEYTFHPVSGIKYALIVHPGGDVSKVKMNYSNNVKINSSDLHIPTLFGDIIDHAPITFYENNKSNLITSQFVKAGKEVSFHLGNYDNSKTVVIDPWTQTPTFTGSGNWNCVWECEKDGVGNVYIIGGVDKMQLKKYNTTGTLQWTYNTPYDTSAYLGTVATDNNGNSFVSGSSHQIIKVDNAGNLVWNNTNPGGIGGIAIEFWSIAFNCDQTKLIIGGAVGGLPTTPYVYDVNVSNGNITASLQVTGANSAFDLKRQEVRSITACGNGRYYWLTHDTIGFLNQNFSFCPAGTSATNKINNSYALSYQCENFKYSNSGICAIKANTNFVYTQNGTTVHKRSLATGAIISSAVIPGGGSTSSMGRNLVSNSGIDIDACGNVYVGSSNAVVKYNSNLVQLATYPTTFSVYDVTISTGGDIIACGSTGTNASSIRTGSVQSFAATACAPLALTCCDATICSVTNLCTSDPSLTLTAATSGGTWSGSGVNGSGVFNPATAGVGTHTIVYSLACGSDSVSITVSPCAALSACVESNGTITVSNGVNPYNWQVYTAATNTPITNQTQCTACGGTWFFGTCMSGITTITSCNTPAAWSNFSTGTNSGTLPGTYPIQVTDAGSTSLTINSLASLSACSGCPPLTATSASIVNVNCFGQSTGSFSVSTTGGVFPYDYVLMNGATTVATFNNVAGPQSFTSLPAGTYTLNVLDNSACPGSVTIIITQPSAALSLAITASTNATCGSNNGSATVLASGGTSGYSYSWAPSGGSSAAASGLAAATYTVTATDSKGCTSTIPVTINSSGGATVAITSQTNVLCFGLSTGSATVLASGGSSPYDYVWAGTSGTLQTTNNVTLPNTLSGLAAGTYTVTVTDNNSCITTNTVIITQPLSAVTVAITASTDATCGSSNGSATALASGGIAGYSYSWASSGGSAAIANNLASGTYTVTTTDGNGCTANTTAVINSSGGPAVSLVSQTNILCNGASTGTATITATGGTGTLTYSWSGGAGTALTANSLTAGTYTVTATDGSGCSNTLPVTITEPNAIVASVNTTPSNCGSSDGAATVTSSGGTGTLTYSWSAPGGSTATLSNIPNGSYTVTVTDANSCVQTATGVVSSIGGPTANAGTNSTIVAGGSILLNGIGTAGATYSWNPSSTLTNPNTLTPTASPLQTTTYTLIVTQNGCSATDSVTVFIEMPCGEIFVPTAFSPNGGDASENEVLKVYGNCILNLEFAIFDRWGEKVFETSSPSIGWDGTYKGKKLDTAVFVYFLKATVDGIEVKKHGNITLVK